MGGIGNFVSSIVKNPVVSALGGAGAGVIFEQFKPKDTKSPQATKRLSDPQTTQFFDPDRGKRVAAARKAARANRGSLKQQFRLDLTGDSDVSKQTRSGLTIG